MFCFPALMYNIDNNQFPEFSLSKFYLLKKINYIDIPLISSELTSGAVLKCMRNYISFLT